MLKYLVAKTYRPLLVKYLAGTRSYSYQNIQLEVPPEVFHPGFFFSTKLLLQVLAHLPLRGKTVLELGAGSGLLSIYAAKNDARVTATDINPIAINTIRKNSFQNKVELAIVESNLFNAIPKRRFDIILLNPPYYKKQPLTWKEYAWYCGANGEFFQQLFAGLDRYMHRHSEVLMVLCDGCDLEMIHEAARVHHFNLTCIQKRRNLVEKNFIFRIGKTDEEAL
jgi:release factor glutamine methyltransferase